MQATDRTQPSGLCGFRSLCPDLSSPVFVAIFTPLLRPIPRPFQASSLGASSERRRYEETQAQKELPFALFTTTRCCVCNHQDPRCCCFETIPRYTNPLKATSGVRSETCVDYIYALPGDPRPFFRHPSLCLPTAPAPPGTHRTPRPAAPYRPRRSPPRPTPPGIAPDLHHFSAKI